MTKITWTKDDFIIKENEVEGFSISGEEKLKHTQTLVIPEGVKAIKKGAFQEKDIKKLVLPTSLVSIYENAFWGCKIREIIGGENVEILDTSALACNILSDISNFKNVRCINRAAFSRNKITNFKAPKTLKFIGMDAFRRNGILICDLECTENLEISEYAFKENGMEELYLGKNANIEKNAFYFNDIYKITGIQLGKPDSGVFKEAIRKSYKKNFEVFSDNSWIKNDFVIKNNVLSGLSQSGKMKVDTSNHITIPYIEGVNIVGQGAFKELAIKTVYISDGYTTIEKRAFCNSYIEYIRLPEDLKKIEDEAFRFSKLKHIKVPKNVASIGKGAFRETNLIKADLSECKIKVLRGGTFNSCIYLREVLLPKTLARINDAAFYETYALKNIEIPEKVEDIQKFAFTDAGIRTIHFKNNLTSMTVGHMSFANSKLTKIIGDDLMFKSIGTSAFQGTFLEEFKAKYVNEIAYGAFRFSPINLVEIKDVSHINLDAFRNCSIKKVKLGGVMKIDREAFALNLIEDLEFFDNYVVKNIEDGAFSKNNLKKVRLGEHTEKIGQFAFIGNPLEEFEISEETEIEMLKF